MLDFYTGLRQYEHLSGRCGQDHELSSRTTTVHLNALDGIGGLEHEGARHRGERKVECRTLEQLEQARQHERDPRHQAALRAGLRYVYTGNVHDREGGTTLRSLTIVKMYWWAMGRRSYQLSVVSYQFSRSRDHPIANC